MHRSQRFLYLAALAGLLMINSACIVETDFDKADVFTCQTDDDCTSGYVCLNGVCDQERPMLACDDLDDDGFFAGEQCTQPAEELDCDDNSNSIYPGAPEQCNGVSDDCDEDIDEEISADQLGCPLTVGVCAAANPMRTCMEGALVPESCDADCPGDDCLYGPDYVPVEGGVAAAGCGDGLDNDCDGESDEDCPTCTEGAECGTPCIGDVPEAQCACKSGPWTVCGAGGEASCIDPSTMMETILPFTQNEICGNMIDDDCNGMIDDGC